MSEGTNTMLRSAAAAGGAVTAALLGAGVAAGVRFARGQQRAAELTATTRYPKLQGLGSVEHLAITPLVDWYVDREDLAGEAGVSYLIQADDTTILFDLGANADNESPSPLLRNVKALGVDLQSVDIVVLSHPHMDHTGGGLGGKVLDPSAELVEIRGRPAYVPADVPSPTLQTLVVDAPRVIAPGVASLGPIYRQDFLLGWIPEQSLAINVQGKGLVLIIGCGHPTVQEIVARVQILCDEPIYGVIGGLHLPVTASRSRLFGFLSQQNVGTGKWPWDPINRTDVTDAIAFLQTVRPSLVALSPHDSCDWSLAAFRQGFPEVCEDVRVGKEIRVA
ncbi:MAG: MBL fold metallo-hydrolase [Chloroflexota bacterium]